MNIFTGPRLRVMHTGTGYLLVLDRLTDEQAEQISVPPNLQRQFGNKVGNAQGVVIFPFEVELD